MMVLFEWSRYNNLGLARKQAKELAQLGDDTIPLLSSLGPHKENIFVGMKSKDSTKFWRFDWDSEKGAHINWQNRFGVAKKDVYKGSISIDDFTLQNYWETINHFPRTNKFIGEPGK